MELTRTDAVFSRIVMVLFLCRNKSSRNNLKLQENIFEIYKKYWRKNQDQGAHTLSTRVGGRPLPLGAPPYLVAPLDLHQPQIQLHIFTFGEKKIRDKVSSCFTIWSHRKALISLWRADLESVRGSGEGGFIVVVIINHPPSPIS